MAACVSILVGNPPPRLAAPVTPCRSAYETVERVRKVHAPFWDCMLPRERWINGVSESQGISSLIPALKNSLTFMGEVINRHREEVLARRWSQSPNSVIPPDEYSDSDDEDAPPVDDLAHEIRFTEFDQSDFDRKARDALNARILISDVALNNIKNGPVWAVWHESPVVR
ncbi:hypothetical protein M427DRAFT_382376 [Gonapodya prolifera JEL478]|uniref:Uncharacterized protein n=1 Tax=Gonapodya prolifera (strain JEL478) TaxID=1344416 RepID=A0A139A9D1_GONPJ|nr:hypothetical protein M427DRAFT_382376 [Gonapodya prolifera JEL478]|eukprot:KXS13294.1 hypothetical protein M427DRAFT_382376 [Gonapodya prolifera JEL478]